MEVHGENIRYDKTVMSGDEYQSDKALQTYRIDTAIIKELQCGTISFEEIVTVAEVLGVGYEQARVLPSGETSVSWGNI